MPGAHDRHPPVLQRLAQGLQGGARELGELVQEQHPAVGEVGLAPRGVRFRDERSEFARPTQEAQRQPLEDGRVANVRARHT
ncbi:MAG: ATP-binding protein, partial [Solirubrobacterales bacterium]